MLWYTQHGAYSASDAVTTLFDGLVTGKGREYNMFYRDFSRKEIHDILQSTGFTYDPSFKFPGSGNNQAYVFNADGPVLIETLGLTQLLNRKLNSRLETVEREARWKWKSEDKESTSRKITYETRIPTKPTAVTEVNILETWASELKTITPGKKEAQKYHNLIYRILITIIDNRLKNPKKEEYIGRQTQRVDIIFRNERDSGFFKQLDQGYHMICPNIFIECKNYNEDIGNPEFGQMSLRLNDRRGQFGIIILRKIMKKQGITGRQEQMVKDGKYVIILDDSDIQKLVKLKLDDKEAQIDELLEEKFKELI